MAISYVELHHFSVWCSGWRGMSMPVGLIVTAAQVILKVEPARSHCAIIGKHHIMLLLLLLLCCLLHTQLPPTQQ
jgi:hypothetical protein